MRQYLTAINNEFIIPVQTGIRGISWNDPISSIKKVYNLFLSDSLYRNSIYVMGSTFVMSFFGFFFWILVARLFPTESVGIATTLISAMTLLNNFSLLGFNESLIRYLPQSKKRNEQITSVLLLVALSAVLSSSIFISLLHIFSPQLSFLNSSFFYIATFVLFVIGAAFNTLVDSIFMAYRSSGNILIKNTILSLLKLSLPLLLLFLGSYGIFAAVGFATFIAALFGYIILYKKYHYRPSLKFNKSVIKEMAVFSSGNYITTFLKMAPALIIPIYIINYVNAEVAAYYYVASMILGFLVIIPSAITHSLFAEGSHDKNELKNLFMKAARIIAVFMLPAIIFVLLFGNLILLAFGQEYADNGYTFLQIISFSALFIALSSMGNAVLKIHNEVKLLVLINIVGILFILGITYLFIPLGLNGIGYGLLIGQAFLALLYTVVIIKKYMS